jgi:uncharacterized protein (DUF1330 family)
MLAMAKAYWVGAYREVRDPARLAEYSALAGPAIIAAGGRFLARGTATSAYEDGVVERTVLVEFDSVTLAEAAYRSEAYQRALAVLRGAAVRDVRIVDGVD